MPLVNAKKIINLNALPMAIKTQINFMILMKSTKSMSYLFSIYIEKIDKQNIIKKHVRHDDSWCVLIIFFIF